MRTYFRFSPFYSPSPLPSSLPSSLSFSPSSIPSSSLFSSLSSSLSPSVDYHKSYLGATDNHCVSNSSNKPIQMYPNTLRGKKIQDYTRM